MARPLKPLVKSGGFYPSRKWTPLVYAGGYTTANGGGEPAPPPIEKTVIGNPIHITDALAKPVQALSVALEPIQDLHGYDSPWPSGGGKNKFDISTISSGTTSGVPYTVTNGTISYNGTASYGGYIVFGTFTLPQTGTYHFHMDTTGDGGRFLEGWTNKGADVTIVCEDTSTVYRIVAVSATAGESYTGTLSNIQVETGSSYTGFAPYSNICPISGWTGANVWRTGVNVWDGVTESGYINVNTGEELSSESQRRSLFVSCKPSTNYVYVNTNAASGVRIAFYDGAKNYVGMFSNNNSNPQSFTTPQNAKYLRFYWGDTSGISINYPSTDTAYEPYQGETYSITFPSSAGTVYGGTLDVTTGKLTVDRAAGVLDGSENITWTITAYGSTLENVYCNAHDKFRDIITTGGLTQFEINIFTAITNRADRGQYTAYLDNGYLNMQFPSGMFSSVAEIKSWLSANNVQFTYPLATPIVYDLTPTQVTTLIGTNNVWSDGTMTLVYLADGNASDVEALNILLGGRYANNHGEDEPTDREALDILLGGTR